MIEQIKQTLEFSELWWNSAAEGEPIAQDEIDMVKELNAAVRNLIGEVERSQAKDFLARQEVGGLRKALEDAKLSLMYDKTFEAMNTINQALNKPL